MSTDKTSVTCPICNSQARFDFSSRDLMFDHYDRYDYFICTKCQCVFQYPMPSLEEINGFYPADYSIYERNVRVKKITQLKQAIFRHKYGYTNFKPFWAYQLLAAVLSPFYKLDKPDYIANGKLLDVGCGNGRYLLTMQSLGWNVQGVEFSENGLKVCLDNKLTVHHGDLQSATFLDNSFDVITVRHLIEHIREPHLFMAELARILKPGGKLMIETPNSDALGRAYLGIKWYANDVPRHLIMYTVDNLSKLASEYDLLMSKKWFDTTPKMILNSIDYVILNKGKPSNKIQWKRMLARLYMCLARFSNRGDTIHTVFFKK